MAPIIDTDWPDVPENEMDFYADLERFHAQRGTSFDRTPKIFMKPIPLYKLFNIVRERGGYDAVTREKLLWRKICVDNFDPGPHNNPQWAFQLKSLYYKQLAAYEIKRVHKQEPPPKSILENETAKGGELLTRTLENYTPRSAQKSYVPNGVDGHDSEMADEFDTNRTPKADRIDAEDPSSTGRVTRGLRQAPAQRVLFQPDVSSSRAPRQLSNHAQSPQPIIQQPAYNPNSNPASNPNSSSFNIANYEPRQPIPLSLRPVPTPASDPVGFKNKVHRQREAQGKSPASKQLMLPGTGFEGPNIYVRTLLALRSGVQEEIDYALHHLVKISHERGDKYKFDAFPGLAEGLTDFALKVSSLFYEVDWEVSYASEIADPSDIHILNGVDGTPDIIDRISKLPKLEVPDDIVTGQFSHRLSKCTEATLVIRNMSMLDANAEYLKDQMPVRDFLSVVLSLPDKAYLEELKHYALDICEQLTKHWTWDENDPLYLSLLGVLGRGEDRGASLTALRSISRVSLELDLPQLRNTLRNLPLSTIDRIIGWTLLDDEELVGASLDFIYQFTAIPENVAFLLGCMEKGDINLNSLLKQLSRLLQYKATNREVTRRTADPILARTTNDIQDVPQDLMTQVLPFKEPERSSYWLRSLFEEDASSDITQIALWQSYQQRFTPHNTPDHQMLAAADFIKNVSTTFPTANAQVINGTQPRFIIKGIRPRLIPTDLKGRPYAPCLWSAPGAAKSCGSFQPSPAAMWEHILVQHLGLPAKTEDTNQWDFESIKKLKDGQSSFNCHWARCSHFAGGNDSPWLVAMHIKTHLPDTSEGATHRAKHNRIKRPRLSGDGNQAAEDTSFPAEVQRVRFQDTQTDERGDAAGLPFTSVLVMRSLARNIPKAMGTVEAQGLQTTKSRGDDGWMVRLFGPMIDPLFQVTAVNRSLSRYAFDLIRFIEDNIEENEE